MNTTPATHRLRIRGVADGPLALTSAHEGRVETVVVDGIVEGASDELAARLLRYTDAELLDDDEHATDSPPSGSGDLPPARGATSRRRNSASATTRKD